MKIELIKVHYLLIQKIFSLGFVRGLSLEDGASTLTGFTGTVIAHELLKFLSKEQDKSWKVLVCGGGVKNLTLLKENSKSITKEFFTSKY